MLWVGSETQSSVEAQRDYEDGSPFVAVAESTEPPPLASAEILEWYLGGEYNSRKEESNKAKQLKSKTRHILRIGWGDASEVYFWKKRVKRKDHKEVKENDSC